MDINFGIQRHSLRSDSSQNAMMYAGTLVAKYHILKKIGMYARLEDFQDPEGILSSAVPIGDYIRGTTFGLEYNPYRTVGLSAEWRILESDHLIFRQGNTMLNQRNEFIVCLDLWF